ncbi:MAG TPA: HAD family hydrolase [Bacillota bacterium]|nr:HAD family hydrolase [Bacillota bacterium]
MDAFIWQCGHRCVPEIHQDLPYRPAIFFDRDGTLIEERHYLHSPADLKLYPETIPGLRLLQQAGFLLYIFTNQAGVAHGFFTESELELLHRELLNQLEQADVLISGILYCPHHPQAELPHYRLNCYGRKPHPGLLFQAAARDHLALNNCYVVGDKLSDILAGKQVGAATVLVLTGYGEEEQPKITPESQPDAIATDMSETSAWILQHSRKRSDADAGTNP